MATHSPTLARFISQSAASFATAPDQFMALMEAIALTGKLISREVNKAGLVDVIGLTGDHNVQGEEVQKLDILSHDVMVDALTSSGAVCIMGSEEEEGPIIVQPPNDGGRYVALFDPLDGSSNIDVGAPIGTIFSIFERRSSGGPGELSDLLRPGREQVAAGYVIYGSSTMIVFSTGQGVHSFTLDPSLGEFLLGSENMQFPDKAKIYSVNESNAPWWPPAVTRWVDGMREGEGKGQFTARYIGSLVADFHRNLLRGGVFAYPADGRNPALPDGKLRLLYEASPLAFLAEAAGGGASNGLQNILDITPEGLHQRTALFIGNRREVEAAERCHQEESA